MLIEGLITLSQIFMGSLGYSGSVIAHFHQDYQELYPLVVPLTYVLLCQVNKNWEWSWNMIDP